MTKRISIKGEGRAIFNRPQTEEQKHASTEAQKSTSVVKVGYYLDPQTVTDIDKLWMKVRAEGGLRITKSRLIEQVVGRGLKDLGNQPIEQVVALLK